MEIVRKLARGHGHQEARRALSSNASVVCIMTTTPDDIAAGGSSWGGRGLREREGEGGEGGLWLTPTMGVVDPTCREARPCPVVRVRRVAKMVALLESCVRSR